VCVLDLMNFYYMFHIVIIGFDLFCTDLAIERGGEGLAIERLVASLIHFPLGMAAMLSVYTQLWRRHSKIVGHTTTLYNKARPLERENA